MRTENDYVLQIIANQPRIEDKTPFAWENSNKPVMRVDFVSADGGKHNIGENYDEYKLYINGQVMEGVRNYT